MWTSEINIKRRQGETVRRIVTDMRGGNQKYKGPNESKILKRRSKDERETIEKMRNRRNLDELIISLALVAFSCRSVTPSCDTVCSRCETDCIQHGWRHRSIRVMSFFNTNGISRNQRNGFICQEYQETQDIENIKRKRTSRTRVIEFTSSPGISEVWRLQLI